MTFSARYPPDLSEFSFSQTTVRVPSFQSVYGGVQVDCPDVQLTSYDFPVSDGNGKPLVAPGTTTLPGKGTITFALRVPSLAYNMCGWVLKNSTGLMTKGALKKRWMVLYDFKLRYFESQFSLDESRGEIHCSDITALLEVRLFVAIPLALLKGMANLRFLRRTRRRTERFCA